MADQVRVTDELLAAVERAMEDPTGADLSEGVHACLSELEASKRGLTYLDHLFGRVLDDLDEATATWEAVEGRAAQHARDYASKGASATEIKAAITRYVNERTPDREARDAYREAKRRLAKLDRWLRSIEHRMGAAQSAQKGHDQLGRYGGGT